MRIIPYLILTLLVASCAVTNQSLTEKKARERMHSLDQDAQQQINILLEMIDEQSHLTDPASKRYIPYEFRIPVDSVKKKEIHGIDPSIQFTNRTDSYQCIGDNASKEKIFQIVALPYTYKIRFCPYE